MEQGFVYLLRTREFIKCNENIYKIGKTKNIRQRFLQYPKNSELLYVKRVENCTTTEKMIIKKFNVSFNQKKDIGREYYEGELDDMIVIYDAIVGTKMSAQECIKKTKPSEHEDIECPKLEFFRSDDLKIDAFEDAQLNSATIKSLDGTELYMAEVVYCLNKNNYNVGSGKWYEFKNHSWKINTSPKQSIMNDLITHYKTFAEYCKKNVKNSQHIVKQVNSVIKLTKNTVKQSNILVELYDMYASNGNNIFSSLLDSKPHLVGFNNGVYDLQKFEFRDGKPDDFITMSTGYNYTPNYSNQKQNLVNFLKSIQPKKKEREYMLTHLGLCLIGLNSRKLFTILTGQHSDEKNKLIELIKLTFGDYFSIFPSKLFAMSYRDKTVTNCLATLLRKRIVIAMEPAKKYTLNCSFLECIIKNNLTNSCKYSHKYHVEDEAKFNTFFVSNDIPEIDGVDCVFARDVRCFDIVKTSAKNISFDEFAEWKHDFFLILVEYYKKYTEMEEFVAPKKNAMKYLDNLNKDIYLSFLKAHTVKSKASIRMTKLYDEFKKWFMSHDPENPVPSSKKFINGVRSHAEVKVIKINNISSLGIKHIQLV